MVTLQHFSQLMQMQGTSIEGIHVNEMTAQKLGSIGIESAYANFFSFILFESGQATYIINSRRHELTEGTILVLSPKQLVFIDSFSADFKAIYVTVDISMIDKILTHSVEYKLLADLFIINQLPILKHSGEHRALVQSTMCLMLQLQKSQDVGIREAMQVNLLRSLMGIVSDALLGGGQMAGICHQEVIYRQFIALVATHYTQQHSTRFYADLLCVTPVYLARIVRRYSGKAVKDFILSLVYHDAIDMLRYTDAQIGEIAQQLGFPNIETFSKFFKKRNGQPPSKVQRR